MTTNRLNMFRSTLENYRAELLSGGRDREAIAIDTSPDELDRIQHARDRDQSIDSLERESRRLREVESALRRMEDDEFGICVGCETEIAARRLEAVPWAPYCIHCQEAEEREVLTPADDMREAMALAS